MVKDISYGTRKVKQNGRIARPGWAMVKKHNVMMLEIVPPIPFFRANDKHSVKVGQLIRIKFSGSFYVKLNRIAQPIFLALKLDTANHRPKIGVITLLFFGMEIYDRNGLYSANPRPQITFFYFIV